MIGELPSPPVVIGGVSNCLPVAAPAGRLTVVAITKLPDAVMSSNSDMSAIAKYGSDEGPVTPADAIIMREVAGFAFSSLTVLVGCQEMHPAHKN